MTSPVGSVTMGIDGVLGVWHDVPMTNTTNARPMNITLNGRHVAHANGRTVAYIVACAIAGIIPDAYTTYRTDGAV